jgi:hypothetical protein
MQKCTDGSDAKVLDAYEYPILDCRMEFMELLRLEGAAEIFAVDVDYEDEDRNRAWAANRLTTIHDVLVPGDRLTLQYAHLSLRESRRQLP